MKHEPEQREWWLNQAMIRLCNLPMRNRRDILLTRLALNLLKGLEADAIPVPIIRKVKSGAIHIYWSQGPRSLEIAVISPSVYMTLHFAPGAVEDPTTHRGGHVDPIRDAVRRIFPYINGRCEHEMNTLAEVVG